jgi:hypothetical protein
MVHQITSKLGVTALNVLATQLEWGVGICVEFSFEQIAEALD